MGLVLARGRLTTLLLLVFKVKKRKVFKLNYIFMQSGFGEVALVTKYSGYVLSKDALLLVSAHVVTFSVMLL